MHTNYPLNPRQWRQQAQALTPTVQETPVGTIEQDYQQALNENDLDFDTLTAAMIEPAKEGAR